MNLVCHIFYLLSRDNYLRRGLDKNFAQTSCCDALLRKWNNLLKDFPLPNLVAKSAGSRIFIKRRQACLV